MIFDEAIKNCKESLKSETKKDKTWEIVRPIDANKLRKSIDVLGEHFSGHNVPSEWFDLIVDEIEEQTTLDYAPVVYAHWEELVPLLTMQARSYKCSKCHRTIKLKIGDDLIKEYPYCHCGAKMSLEDGDSDA